MRALAPAPLLPVLVAALQALPHHVDLSLVATVVFRVNVSVTQAEKSQFYFTCIVFMCYCGEVTAISSMLSLEVVSRDMLIAVV